MADPVQLALGRPFAEQVAAFRVRLGDLRGTRAWDDLRGQEHDRAFMVAGAMKADLLADLAAAVDQAVLGKSTLETFRKEFRGIVEKHGWHGWTGEGSEKGEAWRTRVIYRTNMATSYAAGRHAQLTQGGFAWWVYRHGGSEHPRLHHLAWDGVALPPDDPFWASHYPPNGWGCSCRVAGARTEAGIRRVGGDPDKSLPPGWDAVNARTGTPVGIDKGWNHAPGRTVIDQVQAIAQKFARYPAEIGASFAATQAMIMAPALSSGFARFISGIEPGRTNRKNFFVVGAMQPEWLAAMPVALRPKTAEIAVSELNVMHTLRPAKASPLDAAWYAKLPEHLLAPDWVLLDESKPSAPALLIGIALPNSTARLVIRLDYGQKANAGYNLVTSGRQISPEAIQAMKGQLRPAGTWYTLLKGALP